MPFTKGRKESLVPCHFCLRVQGSEAVRSIGGECGEFAPLKGCPGIRIIGEEDLARRTRVDWHHHADCERTHDNVSGLSHSDDGSEGAVAHVEAGRLAGLIPQVLQDRPGELDDVHATGPG